MPPASRPPKVQRWIDLIATLLRYHFPVDFATIATEVPAYHGTRQEATVKRMFERDKDELRALGIPIESVANADGVIDRYRLRPQAFYLPYLALVDEDGARRDPRRPRGIGYQALASLAFPAEELELVVRAAHRVRQLGDPHLARDAAAALRKLAHDLAPELAPGREHEDPSGEVAERVVPASRAAATARQLLEPLGEAIRRRKRVTVAYHAIGRDAHTTRTIAPYGLAFLSGVWYLVGQEAPDAPIKQYRLQRMQHLVVNGERPQHPDFDIPATFRLADYAAVRQPWELGTEEPIVARVRFDGARQVVHDAMALGTPVDGAPHQRTFVVRRLEAFARWLLAQGGHAVPEAPPVLVDAFHALVAATRVPYGAPAAPSPTDPSAS